MLNALDDDADEFILSWAQEFPSEDPICLRVYLEVWPAQDPKQLIETAIHNHYTNRADITNLQFKRLLKEGRTSIIIGVLFLSACLLLSHWIVRNRTDTWADIVQNSLTIAGWVAMWRPMQIYLYDWWPVRRRRAIFQKLSQIPVEVIRKT